MNRRTREPLWLVPLCLILLAACARAATGPAAASASQAGATDSSETRAADLEPVALAGGARLQVVATTNLVGDAVRRVGGDRIDLTVLLPIGTDPHTYTPTPQDMVAMSGADVIFVNGLGLEESILPTLAEIKGVPVVSVNEQVAALESGAGAEPASAEHDHTLDPHTWQDPRNVRQWVLTTAAALAALDPAHAPDYTQAGESYAADLDALHQEITARLAAIPANRRLLVTDHDNLRYLAAAFDLRLVGAVTPSFSTLSTISAQEMAALQQQIAETGAPAIFVGTTVNPTLADQVAQDTGAAVVTLYTDSLGPAGSPESNYAGMMRSNAAKIAQALE